MPKHLSMFWAATKQLSEPSRPIKVHWEAFITCVLPSLLQTVLSKRILFTLPTPFQPLTPSPQQPRESGSFLHSPVWSQVSPLSQGLGVVVGREQTGHVGMSVGKIQSGRQGRARSGRLDVEIRICRAELGRWEQHTLPLEAKAPMERCCLGERLGTCCVTKSRSLPFSGTPLPHAVLTCSADAEPLCY